MITLAEIQARADRYAAGANPEIEWEMSQDRVWLLERMAQLEAEMEQLHLVVDEYAKALARIATLESELTEAKLQRDSWKRIAESGLGIPAETFDE